MGSEMCIRDRCHGATAEERLKNEVGLFETGELILSAFPELKYIAFSFLDKEDVENFGQQPLKIQQKIERSSK